MRSRQLISLSALCLAAALAVASAPCPWPRAATFDPGGKCMNRPIGGPYCTQGSVKKDGRCEGRGNPKICNEGTAYKDFPLYLLRVPNQGCNVENPCIADSQQKHRVQYTHAESSRQDCVGTVVGHDGVVAH